MDTIYACYTYIGAFIWVTALISLGKVLGPQWEQYHHTLNRYLIYAGIIAALIFLLVYVYRRNKILFTELLTTLMISMIQEYLEKEFKLLMRSLVLSFMKCLTQAGGCG